MKASQFSVAAFRKALSKSKLLLECNFPLGYSQGLPLLDVVQGDLCLIIPFLKYKVTGKVDATLVYPIRYTLTLNLRTWQVVGVEDLQTNPKFAGTRFGDAISTFRHQALIGYDKTAYGKLLDELYEAYDEVVHAMLKQERAMEAEERLREVFAILLDPALLKTYQLLSPSFYEKYLA